MNKKVIFFVAAILVVGLTGCGSPNDVQDHAGPGFWNGLWDGLTVIFAVIGNLLGGHHGVYSVHNNGAWYDFGFLLGIGALGSGASSA